MKKPIERTSREDLSKNYPIEDASAPGWYFNQTEVSNGVYVVEGRDGFGRIISRTGSNPDEMLASCVLDARAIISQVNSGRDP